MAPIFPALYNPSTVDPGKTFEFFSRWGRYGASVARDSTAAYSPIHLRSFENVSTAMGVSDDAGASLTETVGLKRQQRSRASL